MQPINIYIDVSQININNTPMLNIVTKQNLDINSNTNSNFSMADLIKYILGMGILIDNLETDIYMQQKSANPQIESNETSSNFDNDNCFGPLTKNGELINNKKMCLVCEREVLNKKYKLKK